MTVKELVKFLIEFPNQDAEVLILDNGSALKTASLSENESYNEGSVDEAFIVTEEF